MPWPMPGATAGLADGAPGTPGGGADPQHHHLAERWRGPASAGAGGHADAAPGHAGEEAPRLDGGGDPWARANVAAVVHEVHTSSMAQFREDYAKSIAESVAESVRNILPEAVNKATAPLFSRMEKSFQERFEGVVRRIVESERRLDQVEKDQTGMLARLERLERVFDFAKAEPPIPVQRTADWERPLDKCIFVINASEAVSKTSVAIALGTWLEAASYEMGVQCELEGPQLSKAYILRFKADTHFAAEARVRQAHSALRMGPGQWRRFEATAPGDRRVAVYVGLDKNKQDVARERAAKKLRDALSARLDRQLFIDRETGTVLLSWQPVARVLVHPVDAAKVQWNLAGLAELRLDKPELAAVANRVFSPAAVQWSG